VTQNVIPNHVLSQSEGAVKILKGLLRRLAPRNDILVLSFRAEGEATPFIASVV